MIESLRIESWVIVEEALLELGPGLNVLTGETGTGKSIVLGALALLGGARAAGDAVRTGAERAVVEAVLRPAADSPLAAELRARELVGDSGSGELIVHRSVAKSGRSRARVAGELVPVATLADLLGASIEISSQHSSQSLLRAETQGRLLDEAGDLFALRDEVERDVAELRALDAEQGELRAQAEERARRQDFLAFQIAEIDEVGLQPNEIGELEGLLGRLAHADKLLLEGDRAGTALVGDDGHAEVDTRSARDLVVLALRAIDGLADLDPQLAGLAERLRGAEAELVDIAADLERYLQHVDADPARLTEVEARLAAIDSLRRKYGRTEPEISAFRERVAAELAGIEGADARIDALSARRVELADALAARATRLSRGRAKAARALAKRVSGSLGALAMPGARFEIELAPLSAPEGLPCGAGGLERVEFLFSANAGEPPRPLSRVASGGELSRLLLAIRNALRRSGAGMILVFDEVDAGIGGRVAERVGRALVELARHHQVVCITHLPQIAAFGDVHFRVRKVTRKGRAAARVDRIEGDERIDEIARMAGGEAVTPATRKHARELLGARADL